MFLGSKIDGYVHNITEDEYSTSMNETCSYPAVVEQYAFAFFAEYQYKILPSEDHKDYNPAAFANHNLSVYVAYYL